jgi:glycogen operon protein
MHEKDWNFPQGRFLSYLLGSPEQELAPLYVILNAAPQAIAFKLPALAEFRRWELLLDTTHPAGAPIRSAEKFHHAPPRCVLAFGGAR